MYELLFLLPLYASYTCYEVRRCVFDLMVALDVIMKMLSWFDLLLCTSHTNTVTTATKGKSLKHGWRFTAAAVLLYTDFVANTHHARISGIYRSVQTYTYYRSTVCGYYRTDHTTAAVLYRDCHKYY